MWHELKKMAFNLSKQPWEMTEAEIRNELEWSAESENLYRQLNSIDNESNRRGYIPLTDEEEQDLKDDGYIKKIGGKKRLTDNGWRVLRELKNISHQWDMIMGSRYDTVQMMIDEGQQVLPEVLNDYPDMNVTPYQTNVDSQKGDM